MNPNLATFLKRFIIGLLIFTGIVFGIIWIQRNTNIDLEAIYDKGSYILLGIVLLFFGALIVGVVFREIITNILRRAENIYAIYPDKNPEYIHLIAKHYFAGGENSDGYDQFLHYLIRLNNGKIYLSKKLNDQNDISKSLDHLSSQVKFTLSPILEEKNEIGFYNPENAFVERTVFINSYSLDIKSYSSIFDYGFKISCINSYKKLVWKRKL